MEGTIGQWINHSPLGNNIYLVENPRDVGRLEVNREAALPMWDKVMRTEYRPFCTDIF